MTHQDDGMGHVEELVQCELLTFSYGWLRVIDVTGVTVTYLTVNCGMYLFATIFMHLSSCLE